jgi:hypothetical protein
MWNRNYISPLCAVRTEHLRLKIYKEQKCIPHSSGG